MLSVYLNKYPIFQQTFVDYFAAVKDWNVERDNNTYDLSFEKTLLEEECYEFLTANTVVDKLDAYLDYTFVLLGTIHKAFKDNLCSDVLLENLFELQESLFYLLYAEFMNKNKNISNDDVIEILYTGMRFVLDANNTKGKTKNDLGKITKPADFVGPESKLEELLAQYNIKI